MRHSNTDDLLPKELMFEIQQYVQGKSLYIPKLKSSYKKWGDNTQSKTFTLIRNNEIRSLFYGGYTIGELARQYSLSLESIKKIVYCKG